MQHALRTTRPTLSGIDLAAPGGLEALFAWSRARFGDARMSADAGDAGGGDDQQQHQGDGGDQGAGDDTDAKGDQGDAKDGDDLAKLSATDLAKMVRDLRKRDGDARINAKTQAADDARNELVQSLGKALGLIKDGDDTPDAATLTQQLTETQVDARTSRVELAVYKSAGAHQGDPDALLDSRAFLVKVQALDPAAADFQAKVDAAIKDAVKTNPKLKAGRAPGASSVDHSAGGPGEGRGPIKVVPLHQSVSSAYGG